MNLEGSQKLPQAGRPYPVPSYKVNKTENVKQKASLGGMLDSIEKFLALLITAPYWISVGVLGAVINGICSVDEKQRLKKNIIDSLKPADETKKREIEEGLFHFKEEELTQLQYALNIPEKYKEISSFIADIEKADLPLNFAIQFLKRPIHERHLLASILSVAEKNEVHQILNLLNQNNLDEFYSFKLKLENILKNTDKVNKICRLLALMTPEERLQIINQFPFDQLQTNTPLPQPSRGAEEIFKLLKQNERRK